MYFRKMNFLKIILSPFTVIYWAITSIRNTCFNIGLLKQYTSSIPLISIGNLSMGGTGKTPHVAYVLDLLSNYNTAVISRGYGREGSELIEGNILTHNARDLGDEPMELLSKFESPTFKMIVDGNRKRALRYLEDHKSKTTIVLLDDGFQHRYANRNLNIILSDYNKPFYTDFIVPLGTLRESRIGAKRADVIIITKCKTTLSFEEKKTIKARISKYSKAVVYFSEISYKDFKNTHLQKIDFNKNYLLITGIANPKPIYEYLSKQNINFEAVSFSDHHNFSNKDIEYIKTKSNDFDGIITTEKDWMRLKETKLQSLIKIEIFRLEIGITFIDKEDAKHFNHIIKKTLNISK